MSKSQQVPQIDGAGDRRTQTLVLQTPFGDLGLTPLLWEWGRSASTYISAEYIMRNAGLVESQTGSKITRRMQETWV